MDEYQVRSLSVYLGLFKLNPQTHRCVSYCIDMVESDRERSILTIYGYCFYLPVISSGPIIPYSDYIDGVCIVCLLFLCLYQIPCF